jgi:hypothetical protein|eukprot:g1290.t1
MSCVKLCRYAMCGQLESAARELAAGAYVNFRDPSDYERTPLMYAAMYGERNAVKWLVEVGHASLDIKDRFQKTAEDYARENYKFDIVDYFQKWPAELARRNAEARRIGIQQHEYRRIATQRREEARQAVAFLNEVANSKARKVSKRVVNEAKLIAVFEALEAFPIPSESPTSQSNFIDVARRVRPKLAGEVWTPRVWRVFQKAAAAYSTAHYKAWHETPTMAERLSLRYS